MKQIIRKTFHSRRPVDEAVKVFLGQADVAADLFNLCFSKYAKRQSPILPQHLIRLDPAHYNVVFNENGVYKSDNSHRDLLFKCELPHSPGKFIYIGVELQTRHDKAMLERCGRYDLQFYIEQRNDIVGRGGKGLTPIINIVLNLSCTPWTDGNVLIKNPEKWPKELMGLCPNYFINIFDITKLAEKSSLVACDEFRAVLNCYRYRNNKVKLHNILSKGMPNGVLSVNAAILINVCLRLKLKLTKDKEKIEMCKAWEEYTRDCIRKGEIKGKEKSLIEVVKAMLSERLPIASIMKVTGKDYAAICKIAEENGLAIVNL